MKGLKFLVSCVAVGALAVICSTASFAADAYTVGASYSDGEVTLTVPEGYTTIVGDGDLTLLILTATGNSAASITNENANEIIQIDQASAFSKVKVGDLADGTYYVRIGGAAADSENGIPNGFIAGEFTVNSTPDSPYTNPDILLGDVNGDGKIRTIDAMEVLYYYNNDKDTVIKDIDSASAADVNGDGKIRTIDAMEILYYYNNDKDTVIDEVKTIGERTSPCEDF